jgi:hypothetical protein
MRRLASSLIAASGLALLAACSGGGYGLSGNIGNTPQTPTFISFQNGAAGVDDFFLDPTGNSPILVSATAIKGTGSGAVIIPDQVFTWAATYAAAGTSYLKGASPNGSGTCGTPPSPAFPINSLLQQGPGTGAGFPMYNGVYSQLTAQPAPASGPVGSYPTYTQTAAQIFIGVPNTPGAAPPYAPSGAIQPSPAVTGNYCIRVQATHSSGVLGTTIVVVSQSP